MKITQSTRERLVIQDFPWPIGLVFGVLGGGLVAVAIRTGLHGSILAVDVIMEILIGTSFLLTAAIFTKRSNFTFDLTQQQLTWSRISLFGWQGGTMALGRVTGCMVQVLEGPRQQPAYRLALASPDGDLPLSESYSTGTVAARDHMRAAIHTALGLPAPEPESTADIDGLVKSMIVAGQIIGAIKLVRDRRGSSIAEAKDYVDALKGDQPIG